jgi:hypothetical protein
MHIDEKNDTGRVTLKHKAYLDLDLNPTLALVHANHGADHLGQNQHVAEVGLNKNHTDQTHGERATIRSNKASS